jgi:hypothetical protein
MISFVMMEDGRVQVGLTMMSVISVDLRRLMFFSTNHRGIAVDDPTALDSLDRGFRDVYDDMSLVEGKFPRDLQALGAGLKLSCSIGSRNIESF